MCGIMAALLSPQVRSKQAWQGIKAVFIGGLLLSQSRGDKATGVAVLGRGQPAAVVKKPIPAARFVVDDDFAAVMSSVGDGTTLILGHTRNPTLGTVHRRQNNHPLEVGSVLGVHNGHIVNHQDVFRNEGWERQGDVDSEAIFRLINSVHPVESAEAYLQEIRARIRVLKGEYTFLACDLRRPDRLIAARHFEPLAVGYQRTWNALFFSSLDWFLDSSLGMTRDATLLPRERLMLYEAGALSSLCDAPLNALAFGPDQP